MWASRAPFLLALWSLEVRAVAEQTPPAIAFKPASESAAPGMGQWIFAVLACGLLLGLLLWLIRRTGGRLAIGAQRRRGIKIVERAPLTANVCLVTVEYEGRKLLLATGAAHTTCLRDDPIQAIGVPRIVEGGDA